MRALKITLLISLLAAVLLGATLAWLVRSNDGSRWLLEEALAFSPVPIEARGIAGNFAEGFVVQSLHIKLAVADIRATNITVSWSPASLLAGTVKLNQVNIAELGIDLLQGGSTAEPPADQLFWLQLPLLIDIESGQLQKLRIDTLEFAELNLVGAIGHGRLEIASLSGQVAGANLQVSGQLAGPAPGELQAAVSWDLPAANLRGVGNASGDIEDLQITHTLYLPDAVNFNGSLRDLFSKPALSGIADWSSVRLPGTVPLYSSAGSMALESDLRSVRVAGDNVILLDGWPAAPLQLEATADLQGISIAGYTLAVLGGQLRGSGEFDYSDGLRGQLVINGTQLDPALLNENIVGQLGFDATLQFASVDAFVLEVATAHGRIAGNDLTGSGRAEWREQTLSVATARVASGVNRLTIDVQKGQQLSGVVHADLPDLAVMWPGLQGGLVVDLTLGGSLEKPQISVVGEGVALAYGEQRLATLSLSGAIQANSQLRGQLVATGLLLGEQPLGDLSLLLDGTLADHQLRLDLAGDTVAIDLRAAGSWNGEQLTERFDYGRIQPQGFGSWQLEQTLELRGSQAGGQLDAHCWKQQPSSICVAASDWSADSLQSKIDINDFVLASLQPLLTEGYRIDGTVNAGLTLARDSEGLRGELHWQQGRTLISYADGTDTFQSELHAVQITITSDATRSSLAASLTGEEGLSMIATAAVTGPLAEHSSIVADVNGILPSLGLLRPLVQRAVNPGELQGELTINLNVGGTLGDPVFSGAAQLIDGKLGLLDAGITLTDINIAAKSAGSDKLLLTGRFYSGAGYADVVGDIRSEVNPQGKPTLVAIVGVKGEKLEAVRLPDLSVDASPNLSLRISADTFDITGVIAIPQARTEIRDLPKVAVTRSTDVIVHVAERPAELAAETIVTGDVEVVLGDDVRFKGFGLTSRLEGGLRLQQQRSGDLLFSGPVRVRDGFLNGYGKELRVDRGDLSFVGPLDDPLINIQVSRDLVYESRQYTVGLRLTGSAQNVKTEPFSRPAMSDNDVLSFLLVDQPTGNGANASGAALAMGLGQLVPGDGGGFGLDEVGFETNDANQAAMVAGKRINDDIYVRYVFGSLGEPGAFRIRYRLGGGFSLEASTGARQSLDLIYLLER